LGPSQKFPHSHVQFPKVPFTMPLFEQGAPFGPVVHFICVSQYSPEYPALQVHLQAPSNPDTLPPFLQF